MKKNPNSLIHAIAAIFYMKLIRTLMILYFALSASAILAQTIRRVNADPTLTGINIYSTIQAAHDAASNGDILIVEPGSSVGDLNCVKSLTLYGRGYFLDKNPNYSNLPDNSSTPTVGAISINASNTKISGITFGTIIINGGVSGVVISRNSFAGIFIYASASAPISNITITQNMITSPWNQPIYISSVANVNISNVTFSNNQISSSFEFNLTTSSSNILFNQNTFLVGGGSLTFIGTIYNSIFINNIFLYPALNITNTNSINTTFNNNIFTGSSTFTAIGANNNVVGNLSSLFQSNSNGSADNNYRVINGSILSTSSTSGGEVGMFGGSTPYVQYGIPASPSVLKLINTGLGNSTTPINATISATSNN